MRQEVEKYLQECAAKTKEAEDKKRARVLIKAGLCKNPEITEEEYRSIFMMCHSLKK